MPTWFYLTLASAFLLGIYDVLKKVSVKENAVPPVLLLSVIVSAAVWLSLLAIDATSPILLPYWLKTDSLSWLDHLRLLMKSTLVGVSWICAFFSLKHLPMSIAAPIRSTSPLWTVLLAIGFFGERPTGQQALGISVVLIGFTLFSQTGRKEGIHFATNRWVLLMMLATLLGSVSSLYDKYLLQSCAISPQTVQAWFSIYLIPVMLPGFLWWFFRERAITPFQFRASIPLIGVALLAADIAYFSALSIPDALVSLISPLRRTSVIVPFLVGVTLYGEQNWSRKLLCILVILAGVLILSW